MENNKKFTISNIRKKDKTKFTYEKHGLEIDKIYYDLQKEDIHPKIGIAIGDNSIGKTFSVENLIMESMMRGNKSCGIRNTQLESGKCVDGGKSVITRYNMGDLFEVNTSGIYKILDKRAKTKELYAPFIYMSSPDASIPQMDISNQQEFFIGWDEFISGNEERKFLMKEPFKAIRNLMKRLRIMGIEDKKKICLFLIANPHNNIEADILSDLEININFRKLHHNKDIVEYDKKRDIMLMIFPTTKNGNNELLIEQFNFFNKLKRKDDYDYRFPHPDKVRVIKKPKKCYPIGNFTYAGAENEFTVGVIKAKDNQTLFISKKHDSEEHLINYCLKMEDKNGNNCLLIDKNDILKIFTIFINAKIYGDKVFYDSPYTKEHFNKFLYLITNEKELCELA